MPELHVIRFLSLREALQIRPRVTLAAQEQPSEQQIQNTGVLEFQKAWLLYVWQTLQLHPRPLAAGSN